MYVVLKYSHTLKNLVLRNRGDMMITTTVREYQLNLELQ